MNPTIDEQYKGYEDQVANNTANPGAVLNFANERLGALKANLGGEETIGDTYKAISAPSNPYGAYETMANEIGDYYRRQASEPLDERKVFRDTLAQYQAQIDATNEIYNNQLKQAQLEGMGRLGSQRAISARSGTLGSDFGASQKEKVASYNRGIENSINAELNAKIAEIMGTARQHSSAAIAEKRAAKEQGAERYLEYLAGRTNRRQSGLSALAQSFFSQGVTPDEVDPNVLQDIARQYGVSEDDIKASYFDYAKQNAAEAEQFTLSPGQMRYDADGNLIAQGYQDAEPDSFTISEGQSRYVFNPETNQYELVASRAKTFAPSSTASSKGSSAPTGSGQFENDLDAIIGATLSTIPSKFGQETFRDQMSRARDDADRVSLVASQVLKGQPAEVKRDFTNQSVGIKELDKAIAALDSGVKTGAIPATGQYLLNFIGKDYDPEVAKINQHIIAAIQPYRNSVTGAAWGEQEDDEYRALFGTTRFSPPELKQRLLGVREVLKSKSATALGAYVNPMGYFDDPFTSGNYAPENSDVRTQVDQAGYDYDALRADGFSDQEILDAINGNS